MAWPHKTQVAEVQLRAFPTGVIAHVSSGKKRGLNRRLPRPVFSHLLLNSGVSLFRSASSFSDSFPFSPTRSHVFSSVCQESLTATASSSSSSSPALQQPSKGIMLRGALGDEEGQTRRMNWLWRKRKRQMEHFTQLWETQIKIAHFTSL